MNLRMGRDTCQAFLRWAHAALFLRVIKKGVQASLRIPSKAATARCLFYFMPISGVEPVRWRLPTKPGLLAACRLPFSIDQALNRSLDHRGRSWGRIRRKGAHGDLNWGQLRRIEAYRTEAWRRACMSKFQAPLHPDWSQAHISPALSAFRSIQWKVHWNPLTSPASRVAPSQHRPSSESWSKELRSVIQAQQAQQAPALTSPKLITNLSLKASLHPKWIWIWLLRRQSPWRRCQARRPVQPWKVWTWAAWARPVLVKYRYVTVHPWSLLSSLGVDLRYRWGSSW